MAGSRDEHLDKKLDMALDDLAKGDGRSIPARRRSRSPYRERRDSRGDGRYDGGRDFGRDSGKGKGKGKRRMSLEDKALLNTHCFFNTEGDLVVRLYETEVVVLKKTEDLAAAPEAQKLEPAIVKIEEDSAKKSDDSGWGFDDPKPTDSAMTSEAGLEKKPDDDEKKLEAEKKLEPDSTEKPPVGAEKLPEADADKLPKADAEKLPEADAVKLPEADAAKVAKATDEKLPEASSETTAAADAEKKPDADADGQKKSEADTEKKPEAGDEKKPEPVEEKQPDVAIADDKPEVKENKPKPEAAGADMVVVLNSRGYRTLETRYIINESLVSLSLRVLETDSRTWTVSGSKLEADRPFEDKMEVCIKSEHGASTVKRHLEDKVHDVRERDRLAQRNRRGDYDHHRDYPLPPYSAHAGWRPGMPPPAPHQHGWPPPPGYGHPPGYGAAPHPGHGSPPHHYDAHRSAPYSGGQQAPRPSGPLPDSMFQ